MKTAIVHSSYGDITIEYDSGKVISTNPADSYYDNIIRFDVDEYEKHYGTKENEYDILDIGTWETKDGIEKRYVADPNFRRFQALK